MSKAYIPLALLMLGVALLIGPVDLSIPDMPDWVNPMTWVNRGPVTVCIIEETHDRTPLLPSQKALLNSVSFPKEIAAKGGIFLGCFDKDVVDRDKQPPKDLVPYLAAAGLKVKTYPALAWNRGSKFIAIALPPDEKTALEVLK